MGKGDMVGSPQMPAGPPAQGALAQGSSWRVCPRASSGQQPGLCAGVPGSVWPAGNWERWGKPCQPSPPELPHAS